MQGLAAICHAVRKGGHIGGRWPKHVAAAPYSIDRVLFAAHFSARIKCQSLWRFSPRGRRGRVHATVFAPSDLEDLVLAQAGMEPCKEDERPLISGGADDEPAAVDLLGEPENLATVVETSYGHGRALSECSQ